MLKAKTPTVLLLIYLSSQVFAHTATSETQPIEMPFLNWILKLTRADLALDITLDILSPLPPVAQALISCAFITIVPIFLIYAMNVSLGEKTRDSVSLVMIAFAIGGLLGDVFFHELPHIAENDHGNEQHVSGEQDIHGDAQAHGHGHSMDAMWVNSWILVGIVFFFLMEMMLDRFFSYDASAEIQQTDKSDKKIQDDQDQKESAKNDLQKAAVSQANQKEVDQKGQSAAVIAMVGDFIHNVTDGISIGVTFGVDLKMGLMTTAAMFFHEIPHEVGDFAILFNLKYTIWQVVGLQLLTGLGSMVGAIIGAYLGQIFEKECLAFTSGGFMYFAINSLFNELKKIDTVGQLVASLVSLVLGLYLMFACAMLEHAFPA